MEGTTCPVCAVDVRAGARFCDACGHPVAGFDLAYRQFSAIGADGWLKNMTPAR
jgi:hypothetical protein